MVKAPHTPACACVSHCNAAAESTQPKQAWLVQSTMHALLWLHTASTNGATQVRTPLCAANSTSNGWRQLAQAGLAEDSNVKKAEHAAVAGPPEQAAAAFWRSAPAHTGWRVGPRCCSAAGHPGYGPGHCVCWLAQVRGDTFASQVDAGRRPAQSWQAFPSSPHWVLTNPGWHCPFRSQHPVQLCEQGIPASAPTHALPMHWAPRREQSRQRLPDPPHWVSVEPCWQLPTASQQPLGHVCELQRRPPSTTGRTHCWLAEHCAPFCRQFWQFVPKFPHCSAVSPCWHWPAVSQQPVGHDCALQTPASAAPTHS